MEGKVSKLAEKLLQEGVQKGEAEKKAIIAVAQTEAQALKNDAQEEADALIADAKKQSEELKVNTKKEIALAGTQAVNALQQKITDLITTQAVDESITTTLSDPKVMSKYITSVLKSWKGELGADASIELLLPEAQKASLEKDLTAAIKKELDATVTLSFSKKIKGGFQIAPVGETYKVTLSNEDFAEFFKEYLRPRVRTTLFGA